MAEEFADEVARENCMEFTDLNEDFQPFQRQYTGDIIKVQEIERQIKSIEELLVSYRITVSTDVATHDIEEAKRPGDSSQIIDGIGREVNEEYKGLTEQATAEKQLKAELNSQEVCDNDKNSQKKINQINKNKQKQKAYDITQQRYLFLLRIVLSNGRTNKKPKIDKQRKTTIIGYC